jgi:hypothetical protein
VDFRSIPGIAGVSAGALKPVHYVVGTSPDPIDHLLRNQRFGCRRLKSVPRKVCSQRSCYGRPKNKMIVLQIAGT